MKTVIIQSLFLHLSLTIKFWMVFVCKNDLTDYYLKKQYFTIYSFAQGRLNPELLIMLLIKNINSSESFINLWYEFENCESENIFVMFQLKKLFILVPFPCEKIIQIYLVVSARKRSEHTHIYLYILIYIKWIISSSL